MLVGRGARERSLVRTAPRRRALAMDSPSLGSVSAQGLAEMSVVYIEIRASALGL